MAGCRELGRVRAGPVRVEVVFTLGWVGLGMLILGASTDYPRDRGDSVQLITTDHESQSTTSD
jgi:hypothetical protein